MSYLEHFNLKEQPFRLTPDPDFLYWSKQHARAKAYMESTIWLADGFVVITGDIGSGKTTLLHSFLSELDDEVVYAMVSQTQLNDREFLQAILVEFGFKPFGKEKVELLDILNTFLIEQYAAGKKVLLIVDEAQNLSRKVLEEVRMLSGIETRKEKVLRIILAGQPELRQKLDSPRMKQLVQRVRLRFHLGPLNASDMRDYIEHRLAVAGRTEGDLFDSESYDFIHRYSGGVPRLINTLCDSSLLCAFADEKDTVTVEDVMSAINELDWDKHENGSGVFPELKKENAAPAISTTFLTRLELRHNGETVSEQSFPTGRAIIGRSPDNDVYVNSRFVSRHHAQLVTDDNGATIEDLNSTNGIFVNEKQVKSYRLQHGDVVTLGVHELVYYDLRLDRVVGDDEASAFGN